MNILVTGGAGYIGSFMAKRLLDEKHSVVIADNLERGHQNSADKRVILKKGNLSDKNFVKKIFDNKFDAVIHFAGFISMEESMQNPGIYFNNNIFPVINILEEMVRNNSTNFIFSSTAGIYGNPVKIPISEDHPTNPTNPYGESKLIVEKILFWYQKIFGISFAALRYFNACGASLDGEMGEAHNPETHIIPKAIEACLNNLPFTLFGNTYNTKDGTCIRDYIHVLDLVEGHILALDKLEKEKGAFFYNIGTGQGFSNKEVIEMVKKVTGMHLEIRVSDKRPGDASVLIADNTKIKNELGFAAKYSDLETIVKSAWEWHRKMRNEK